ncbi:MAG: chemotaxis protein CheX [Deltaproteobacteria bacterium]|nr:chemotaxis protein CheX [Deltaproteobacteria bacterium]
MDVRYINPFIESTIHVLQTMSSITARVGKPYLKKDEVAKGDVSGIIGLAGDVKGSISVSFRESCILPIVSNMFGERLTELNDEVKDAVGEISNMISGQARQKLELIGRNLQAAIPIVIMGRDHTISHITKDKIVAIPFMTDNGEFTIEVSFEE